MELIMSKRHSNIKNWLRGGQIVDHNIRMFKQIAKRVALVSLTVSIIYVLFYVVSNTNVSQRKLALNYYYSSFMVEIVPESINHVNYNNRDFKFKHAQVVSSKNFIQASKQFESITVIALIQALILNVLIYFLISSYIRRRGKIEQSDKFMRGGAILDNKAFKKHLKKKHLNKDLALGVVPTIKDTETIHFEISGAPGTGKSQTLKSLIGDIRSRGDRAIIYSSSTEFITDFYDESTDVILNPLDDRSPNWSIWNEVQEVYHYDDIAASLIPEAEGGVNDPFWTQAARSLFANVARKLKESGNYSTKLLFDKLLSSSLGEVAKLVKDTESAILFSDGAQKTALSVRATLSSYLSSFKFLTNQKGDFSIRNWVKNEDNNQGFVFITSIADQHEVIRPLISCWVDTFASSLMNLGEDRARRIWLIIDELPSLQKLKSLEKILAESRKYGGCVVLGYQSYSKVEAIYGDKGAKTLSDLTASKIFFRSNDQYNAQHASDQLGREEIKTASENISMGAHTMRDSVSITETEKLRELVLPTQILNLENLHGFYRLPGDYPVVSFKQSLFKSTKQQVPGFIASTKTDHLYMLEGSTQEGDTTQESSSADLHLFDEANLEEIPSHVTEQIPTEEKLTNTSAQQDLGLDASKKPDIGKGKPNQDTDTSAGSKAKIKPTMNANIMLGKGG